MNHADTVRAYYAAWKADDLDAVMDLCTEDVIAINVPIGPIHGKAKVRSFFARFGNGMTDKRYDVHRIIADDNVGGRRGRRELRQGRQAGQPALHVHVPVPRWPDLRMARLLRPADGAEAARPAARRLASAEGRLRQLSSRMGLEARRPPWLDPAVPAREDCVLKAMLDTRAARHPERRFALFEDGSTWTYGECLSEVRAAAAGLQRLGVRKGDRVIAWLPTGRPMVLTWFATNYLGAVFVPLNTAYRGDVLAHVVNAAAASVMVAHHSLVERLDGLELPHLRQVVTIGPAARTTQHPARATRRKRPAGRRRAARRERRHQSLGHPVDHLHIRHHGSLQGRAVTVPAALHDGHDRVRLHGRWRGHSRQPAAVPRRRHEPDVRGPGSRRQHLPGRWLQHSEVLGPGAPGQLRHHLRTDRRDGCVPREIRAAPGRQGQSVAVPDDVSGQRRRQSLSRTGSASIT